MRYEEQVRAKHGLEDSLAKFILYISVMNNRELELSAARIADQIGNEHTGVVKDNELIKGSII